MTALGALTGLLFALGVGLTAPLLASSNRRLTEGVSALLGEVGPTPWPVVFWREHVTRVLSRFRLQQLVVAAAASLGAFCWLGLMVLAGRTVTPARGVLLILVVVVGAVAVTEFRARSGVLRRKREKFVQLADIADLLALAVTAGEPLVVAIAQVARVSKGALAQEITAAVEANMGRATSTELLRQLRDQADVLAVQRFFAGLAAASERGTPVAQVLRAQAKDVRAALARDLMESAGRREIAMLAPVVFLILPCVVLVALYPGFVAIKGVI
jgi:tight adherence protein C